MECPYCEGLKDDVKEMGNITRSAIAWQATFETKLDAMVDSLRQTYVIQEDIRRCLNDIKVDLAKNYVGKDEYLLHCTTAETNMEKIKSHINSIPWKLLALNVPIVAVIITIFQWITNSGGI